MISCPCWWITKRLYAGGKIPGGFLRREGRPPEKVTLTGRLIDQPLRPLFPSWLRDDIQVVATTVSMDEQVPPDVLAVTGASVAILLAKMPFYGPMAGVPVGLVGDDFIINPTYSEIKEGELDLVVAGSPDGVIMVEASANQLPEQDIIEAIDFGYEAACDLIQAQREIMAELGIDLVVEERRSLDWPGKLYSRSRRENPSASFCQDLKKTKQYGMQLWTKLRQMQSNLRSPNSRKRIR